MKANNMTMFMCPFNSYHKMPDFRKLQFHISRCGDRRGKNVYRCNHNQGHLFICPQSLVMHEQRCEQNPQRNSSDDSCVKSEFD